MATIEKKIELRGSKGSQQAVVLFDSGSSYSCTCPELAKALGHLALLSSPERLKIARTRTEEAKNAVLLDFLLNGLTLSDEFMVVAGLTRPVIIGDKTLRKWRIELDFEHDKVIVDPRAGKLRL